MGSSDLSATLPPPRGLRVGYLRVSSADQNDTRQLDGIQLDKRFTDQASGKDTARPQLVALLSFVRQGDAVLVHSMDRLARNVDDLRGIVGNLTDRGISVQFMRENLTFTGEESPLADLLLSVLGAVAQFERDLIRERQREGIAIAKQRGKYKGRRHLFNLDQARQVKDRVLQGESPSALAREFSVNRATIYRYASGESSPPAMP